MRNYFKKNRSAIIGSTLCAIVFTVGLNYFGKTQEQVEVEEVEKPIELPHLTSTVLGSFTSKFAVRYHYVCFFGKIYYVEGDARASHDIVLLVNRVGYSGGYSCEEYPKLLADYEEYVKG